MIFNLLKKRGHIKRTYPAIFLVDLSALSDIFLFSFFGHLNQDCPKKENKNLLKNPKKSQ
jgi:hypothetical protein